MVNNRRNVWILFFTLVVVMIGFGVIIPILPFYVESFGAGGATLGLLMATYGVMQFIFAPIWGSLSDHHGRKPILLLGVVGNILSQILMGLSTHLWMLFAARALAGILSSATLPTAMAYITDSTSHDERGGGLGKLGAAMGVGMVLGPGLGGWLATRSLSLPFFLAAGLSVIAFALVVAILPESLPAAQRTESRSRVNGPQFGAMWAALWGPLGVLLLLAFLLSFGLTNFESVFGLYALKRFAYGPAQVGGILMLIGVASAVVQGALTGPATRRWGETTVISAAMLGTALGFVLMLLPGRGNLAGLLASVLFFVSSNAMISPAVSSLLSKRSSGGQGMVMGLNNAFMSLGRMVGPVWAGFAFDANLSYPYLSGAVVLFIGFIVSLLWLKAAHPKKPTEAQPHVHISHSPSRH